MPKNKTKRKRVKKEGVQFRGFNRGVQFLKKGVQSQGRDFPKISPQMADVLRLLTEDFETPKRIALRRKTSLRAVYKTIKKLRKIGLISQQNLGGFNNQHHPPTPPHQIRLHGQEFRIKILKKNEIYDNLRVRKNHLKLEGNTILLHQNSIRVFCSEHRDFRADTPDEAAALSLKYFTRLFQKIEQKLSILIIDGEKTSIKQYGAHYSEMNNELAEDTIKKKEKIRVIGKDGKIWLTFDNSLNLNEAETVHPDNAHIDMQDTVQPFFNDLRVSPPATLSEILKVIYQLALHSKETAAGLNGAVTILNTVITPPDTPKEKKDKTIPEYIN